MKLWHDDIRLPPDGWMWVRTNDDAKAVLRDGRTTHISLDHDLGCDDADPYAEGAELLRGTGEETGLDLVDWMIENDLVPPTVIIHSWNPVGAERMRRTLAAHGHFAAYVPYQAAK